jgi:hypothetical protein
VLLFQELHVAVQLPKELLNTLQAVLILKAQGLGHFQLVFEIELVALPATDMVEPVSYSPDK